MPLGTDLGYARIPRSATIVAPSDMWCKSQAAVGRGGFPALRLHALRHWFGQSQRCVDPSPFCRLSRLQLLPLYWGRDGFQALRLQALGHRSEQSFCCVDRFPRQKFRVANLDSLVFRQAATQGCRPPSLIACGLVSTTRRGARLPSF